MATYTYICEERHKTDIDAFIEEKKPSDIECRKCGAKAFRIYQKMTFILRGRGWASKPELPNN